MLLGLSSTRGDSLRYGEVLEVRPPPLPFFLLEGLEAAGSSTQRCGGGRPKERVSTNSDGPTR